MRSGQCLASYSEIEAPEPWENVSRSMCMGTPVTENRHHGTKSLACFCPGSGTAPKETLPYGSGLALKHTTVALPRTPSVLALSANVPESLLAPRKQPEFFLSA